MHTPRSGKLFWKAVFRFLGISSGEEDIWTFRFYEALGCHFQELLESAFPNLNGARLSSIAWWLAGKSSNALSASDAQSKHLLEDVIEPLAVQSYLKWQLSRSSVGPSSFRHATLKINSIWKMAVISQLVTNTATLPWGTFPSEHRDEFTKLITSFLVSTPVCLPVVSQSDLISVDDFGPFIKQLSPSEDYQKTLTKLISSRKELGSEAELTESLLAFGSLSDEQKIVTLVSLRDAVFSSTTFDGCVAKWLESHTKFANDIEALPDLSLIHI